MEVLGKGSNYHHWKHDVPRSKYAGRYRRAAPSFSLGSGVLHYPVFTLTFSVFLCVLFLLSWMEGLFGKLIFMLLCLPSSKQSTFHFTPLASKLRITKNEFRRISSKKEVDELLQEDSY